MQITGKALIEAGIKPSSRFTSYIQEANDRLAKGDSFEAIITSLTKAENSLPALMALRGKPLPIQMAVDPETELEQQNVDAAKKKIEELSLTPIVTGAAIMPDTCLQVRILDLYR